jgi:hypothetical protein
MPVDQSNRKYQFVAGSAALTILWVRSGNLASQKRFATLLFASNQQTNAVLGSNSIPGATESANCWTRVRSVELSLYGAFDYFGAHNFVVDNITIEAYDWPRLNVAVLTN